MHRALLLAVAVSPLVSVAAETSTREPVKNPSPATALGLSLGTTAAGIATGIGLALSADSDDAIIAGVAIGGFALVVGPSTGHFYVGEARQWTMWTRLGLGAASLAFFTAAAAIGVGCALGSHDSGHDEDCGGDGFAILGTLSATGVVVLAVYDIVDAPFAARRKPDRRRSFAVSPRPGGGLVSAVVRF